MKVRKMKNKKKKRRMTRKNNQTMMISKKKPFMTDRALKLILMTHSLTTLRKRMRMCLRLVAIGPHSMMI